MGFNRPAAQAVNKTCAVGKMVHAGNLGKVGQEHSEFKASLGYREHISKIKIISRK